MRCLRREAIGAAAIALALLTGVGDAGAETSGTEISGWGGFPLSDRVTALWLIGPARGGRPQPMIMVYYRGHVGWHKRKWDLKSQFGKSPSWIRLTSPDIELAIEYGPVVKVQEHIVDLSVATVFLIDPVVDASSKPVLQPLGVVFFAIPAEANPAVYILETNPALAAKVLR